MEENNGEWVWNKSYEFPSLLAFILSIEKQENKKKQNKAESVLKCYILILNGQKVLKIKP